MGHVIARERLDGRCIQPLRPLRLFRSPLICLFSTPWPWPSPLSPDVVTAASRTPPRGGFLLPGQVPEFFLVGQI
ncbi:hypothetical protein QJS10_CPA01g02573 [Acorus calamus]|uniref:Uncharacterized protein n=1 Tax=Acorus calamus TaxID=4465 RepID=A0AAV9FMI5_ACOCL|nr:hypothetical protein QJS10_CPA01g02573 [Acorus calamus]